MKKGDYGYLTKKKKKHLIIMGILAVLIIGLLAAGILLTGKKENLLTILAIVLVLPFANYATTLLVFIKKKSCSQAFFERFEAKREGHLSACDMVITSKDMVIPIEVSVICGTKVAAFTSDPKVQVKEAQKFMEAMLRADGLDVSVHIFKEEGPFFGFLSRLPKEAPEDEERQEKIKACLLSISI